MQLTRIPFGPHLRGNIAGERLDRQFLPVRSECVPGKTLPAWMEPMLMIEPARPAATAWRQKKPGAQSHSPRKLMLTRSTHCWSVQLPKKGTIVFNACVVHQHIDRSEFFSPLARTWLRLASVSSLHLPRPRSHAGPLLLAHAAIAAGLIARPDVVDDHVCTFFGEHFCYAFCRSPWLAPVMIATFIAELHDHPLCSSESSSHHRPSTRARRPYRKAGSRETKPHRPGPPADSTARVESFSFVAHSL